MIKYLHIFYLALFIKSFLLQSLYSQQPDLEFDRLTSTDGLSHNTVFCITQDHFGFMWFGTGNGLNKFDGYTFTAYYHVPGDTTSLSSNFIMSLAVDYRNTLWIGTGSQGLNRFNRISESFQQYRARPKSPGRLQHNTILALLEDRSKRLWIGTMNGLHKLDSTRQHFTVFQAEPGNSNSLSGNEIMAIAEDHLGTLWIGTHDNGVTRFNTNTGEFKQYPYDPSNPNGLHWRVVYAITEDRAGNIWVGLAGAGLANMKADDIEKGIFSHFKSRARDVNSLSNQGVRSLLVDRSGRLWVGTWGGLNLFDNDTGEFTRYQHHSGMINSLSGNFIEKIFEDSDGNLWIATQSGINKWSKRKKPFRTIVHRTDDPGSLTRGEVRAICQDSSSNLWFGTWGGGVSRMPTGNAVFTHYRKDRNNPHSLSNDWVNAMCTDHSGNIWIGTNETGGLNQYDPETGRFIHYKHNPADSTSLSHNMIWTIMEDRDHIVWIGTTQGGLNKFDRLTQTFQRFQHIPSDTTSLSHNAVRVIYQDRSGILWIGTPGGLNRYNARTESFVRYMPDPSNPNSLPNGGIFSIYEDTAGRLWIGSDGGLSLFERKGSGKEIFYTISQKDRLPNNRVQGIQEDGKGHLWFSNQTTITRFNPGTRAIHNFDIHDGLHSNSFHWNAYSKDKTGKLYYGGQNGITVFHPDSIVDNPHVPPIVITAFKVANEPFSLDSNIVEKEQIVLAYDENFFSLEFAALDYTAPEKNQYAYQLEGVDKDWVFSNNRRFANYTDVEPGCYTFRVKGANNDGVWNEESASLEIVIIPPWWRTWWAYSLYVLLFAVGFILLQRYEMNRQRLKHELALEHIQAEKLAEVDRMKSHFFANISHEFRTPLTLILGPLEKLISQTENKKQRGIYFQMQRNGQRLLRLINQLLALSKLEAGKMTLQAAPYDLTNVLKPVVMAFESLASIREIALKFEAPDAPVTIYLDRDKFEKIMINVLSNAFKFTPQGGSVTVSAVGELKALDNSKAQSSKLNGRKSEIRNPKSEISNFVEIAITDTGTGIAPEKLPKIFDRFYRADTSHTREHEGSGIGLALTKELLALHNGNITVESQKGSGTTFHIFLPLGSDHLQKGEIAHTSSKSKIQPMMGAAQISAQPNNAQHLTAQPHDAQRMTGAAHLTAKPTESPVILIIEDNPDMRGYIREFLEADYKILEAENGASGLKAALKAVPDLIVSDVMMPEMDGVTMCKKLKTNTHISHIPLILLTAKAGDENKLLGLETGADDYLTKPFNVRELQVRIKNLIEQRQSLKERFRREVKVEPQDIAITSADEQFLRRAMHIVEENFGNTGFDTHLLAKAMGFSRSQLNRKLRGLTGHTTVEFIRTLRLKRAAQLLQKRTGNISEIAYAVGFNNPAYFAECFRKQFGQVPSEFQKTAAD